MKFMYKSVFYFLASALHNTVYKTRIEICAEKNILKEKKMETEKQATETCNEEPRILEEIQVEELAIDGICGVY